MNCQRYVVSVTTFVILLSTLYAKAGPMDETRFCGSPIRNANGEIIRRHDVLRAFERLHPKPGPGWIRDHIIPLACGGCDSVTNLQWLPEDQWREKSKWERKVYGGNGISPRCP